MTLGPGGSELMLGALLLPNPGSAQADKPSGAARRRLLRRLVYLKVRAPRGTGEL